MKDRLTAIIIIVMLIFSMLPTSAFATDDIIPGYDDHDMAKMQAFLDLSDGEETNAQKLNYDRNRPTTWSYVSWDESTPKRVRRIDWNTSKGIAGDLDLSGCTGLEQLIVGGANLTSVNVSGCTTLHYMACGNSEIESVNISGCGAMEELYVTLNSLTAIDVSACPLLKTLNCQGNQITAIDVSHNPLLEDLECFWNPITSLDVSGHTLLNELLCNECELETLNISGCTALNRFFCHDNHLKSVDISTCTALTTYFCSKNDIEALDLGAVNGLELFNCTENPMTSFRGVFLDKTTTLKSDGNGYIGMFYRGPSFVDMYALAAGNGATAFVNWTDETGASVGTDLKKTLKYYNDNNFTAHFSECMVTFDKNGGDTDAEPNSAVVPVGTKVGKPETDPTRDGYAFGGWYKESGCDNAWDFDNDIVDGNTTLYAKWTPDKHVTSVTLSSTSETLAVGETATLTAEVLPEDTTYPEVTWESSNTDVATVDGGVVTAVSVGSATITAAADGHSDTCAVKVKNIVDFYNAHDVAKIRAFLEQESSVTGVKNGKQLSIDYDPQDPRTWAGVTWDLSAPSA